MEADIWVNICFQEWSIQKHSCIIFKVCCYQIPPRSQFPPTYGGLKSRNQQVLFLTVFLSLVIHKNLPLACYLVFSLWTSIAIYPNRSPDMPILKLASMTSSYHNFLFQNPISLYSYIVSCEDLIINPYVFCRHIIQAITPFNLFPSHHFRLNLYSKFNDWVS